MRTMPARERDQVSEISPQQRLAAGEAHLVDAKGGEDVDENTRNLCTPCHDEVTAEQFGHKQKQAIGTDGWPK